MRGDKFIGGASAQSGTVFAGRIGPQAFRLRNRWTHALTVGVGTGPEAGYVFGFFGALEPDVWSGQQVTQVRILESSPDVLQVQSISDPFLNVDVLRVTFEEWGAILAPWNGPSDSYRVEVPGLYAWIVARENAVLGVRFGKVS